MLIYLVACFTIVQRDQSRDKRVVITSNILHKIVRNIRNVAMILPRWFGWFNVSIVGHLLFQPGDVTPSELISNCSAQALKNIIRNWRGTSETLSLYTWSFKLSRVDPLAFDDTEEQPSLLAEPVVSHGMTWTGWFPPVIFRFWCQRNAYCCLPMCKSPSQRKTALECGLFCRSRAKVLETTTENPALAM